MNRKSHKSRVGSDLAKVALFGLLALTPLAIGLLLLAIRHFALSETRAARNWIATPCVIDTCAFRQGARGSRATLEIAYRYQFGGQSYHGDRLDLLMGSMGDDAAWEKRIFERHPPGSEATCYVDPTNPANSVFDRDNAATKSRNLWLLSFPFLCVGSGFVLAILKAAATSTRSPANEWGTSPGPPPRRVSWLSWAAVLAGPPGAQLAWLFVVGFTYVFVILDGPKQYAGLLWPARRDAEVVGRVADVRRLDLRELQESVYQYEVEYEVAGTRYTCTSATRGQQYRQGDEVTLNYSPDNPARAVIAGARESSLLWWHSALPLGVLALLALGLAAMLVNNFRVARLLKHGQVAQARWIDQPHESPANASAPGNEAPKALSNYHFNTGGIERRAYSFGPAPSGKGTATEPPVLYDAKRPERNVLFASSLATLVNGQCSKIGLLLHCAPAVLAALAIWLLFAVG